MQDGDWFTHVTACTLAESPSGPPHPKLRQLRCLRCRFVCYRGRTSSAVLTLTDSASDSPQKVAITATVIAPKANVSPSSLSFGSETENDESAAKTVTLSDPGSAARSLLGGPTGLMVD